MQQGLAAHGCHASGVLFTCVCYMLVYNMMACQYFIAHSQDRFKMPRMKRAAIDLKIDRPPQTLREIALERMRGAIIAGYFASGERLVERVLCEELGVSRSEVREVIRYVESDGLVETQPNHGPIVATLDWRRAKQIYNMRLRLERDAAAACAELADEVTKARLKDALKVLEGAHRSGQTVALFDATTRFYEIIFLAAGHDIAWEIVQRLNSRISRLRGLTLATKDRHVSGQARMAEICRSIVEGDPEAASRAVEEHLTEAAAIARRLLEEEDSAEQERHAE